MLFVIKRYLPLASVVYSSTRTRAHMRAAPGSPRSRAPQAAKSKL